MILTDPMSFYYVTGALLETIIYARFTYFIVMLTHAFYVYRGYCIYGGAVIAAQK